MNRHSEYNFLSQWTLNWDCKYYTTEMFRKKGRLVVPRHGAIVSKAYFISSGFTGKNISGFVCFVRDNVCGKFEISFY